MGWTIGRLFGIPVRLHFTMVLVPFITYNWMPVHGLFGIFVWASLVVLLFGSVLLHELGHALTARRFGIHTQDIVLTPIGGIARVTDMPRNPRQEIAIAVAGPIVSLVLAALGFALLIFMIPFFSVADAAIQGASLFFRINLLLAVFNLIPALPMDGGRVLRGILALKRDHLSATRIAVRIGRVLALLGGGYALMDLERRFNVGLIAVFIYIAAGSELRMAELRAAQDRMRAQGGGMPFGFPFGGGGGRPFTWTWRSGGAAVQEEDGFDRPAPPLEPDWSTAKTDRERDAVIIGGKAEIVGRRDPKKE